MRCARSIAVSVALVVGLLALARPSHGALTTLTVNKCLAGKLKTQGKGVAAYTSCYGKYAATGDEAKLATCLAKANDKITAGFAKLDGKYPGACAVGNGDGPARAGDAQSFGIQVQQDVGSAFGKCDAAKQKCVGKYVSAVLGCYAKAANKDGVVDGQCLSKASTKLANGVNGCLDKAAASGYCTHVGSQVALLGGGADVFDDAQGCLLDPAAGGCGGPVSCPATIEFAADGAAAATRVDLGWNYIGHDRPYPTGGMLTVDVIGPSGSDCAFTGPIANTNANAGAIDNQRCTGDTSVHCTNAPGGGGGPCTGLGTCEFFVGAPVPLYLGGFGICMQDRIVGAVTGTVNPTSGAVARTLTVERSYYASGSGDAPCARCVGDSTANDGQALGTCDAGPRFGLACDANASIAAFPDSGRTSLDCTQSGFPVGVETHTTTGTTGTSSLTLTAASPDCRDSFHLAKKCACDTCNNGALEPCGSNADCPVNDGQPGVCGGRRCILGSEAGLPCRTCYGGTNAGGFCTAASACPGGGTCMRLSCGGGGLCAVPGEPTKPSACFDDTSTPMVDETLCSDTGTVGDHEGSCPIGPVVQHCTAASGHPQRECSDDADCCDDAGFGCIADPPTPGECGVVNTASCYLDNGVIGGSISAVGSADVPGGTIATPVIGETHCSVPTQSAAVNLINGLPGPTRLQLREHMRLRP